MLIDSKKQATGEQLHGLLSSYIYLQHLITFFFFFGAVTRNKWNKFTLLQLVFKKHDLSQIEQGKGERREGGGGVIMPNWSTRDVFVVTSLLLTTRLIWMSLSETT